MVADPGETTNRIDAREQADQRVRLSRAMNDFFRKAGAPPLSEWRSTTRQQLPAEHG
jgi:hypothetical protein